MTPDMDRVIVKGLVLEASVGVSDAERAAPQRCRVDVELAADLDAAGKADDISKTIDYAAVVETLREVAATRTARLLEALASQMIDALFERFGPERITQTPPPGRAIAVTLRLVKLDPPVDADVDRIGVELERTATPRRAAAPGPLGFR
jgi:dihydroneopterin aldolase